MAVGQGRWRARLPVPGVAGLSGERRRTLLWMCLLIGVNQLGFGAIVPVTPLYAQSFGVSAAAIGLTIAVYGLARFVVNLPAGRAADRRGRRPVLAVGGLVTALGNAGCAVAPDYTWFLIARFVAGAGAAMVLTGGQAVLADISETANRGRVMALYQGVFLFAVGAGQLPGGLLATHLGLAAPFAANSALTAGVSLLAWFRVPETLGTTRQRGGAAKGAGPALSVAGQLRLLRSVPGFGLIGLVSFTVFFARTGALFNVIPVLGNNRLGLGPTQIALGLSLISVVGLVLAYPSGTLVDRFGRKAVIVPSTLLGGGAMLLFALVGSYAGFLVACLLWASATGIAGAAPAAYAADVAPPGVVASALGTYRMVSDFGYVAGPLLLGALADVVSPVAALVFTALLNVGAGLAFARRAPETLPRRPAGSPSPPAAMPATPEPGTGQD